MTEPVQVTLTIAIGGLLLALLHRWITAIERRIDERLQQLGESQRSEDTAIRKLAGEIEDLRDGLPQEYVRREDWIRFSAVLEAKIDRIAERQWEVAQALRTRDGNRS
jgi:hypothetical protein